MLRFKSKVAPASVSAPDGDTTFATPPEFLSLNPGLLSTSCSPGIKRIVVLSIKSFDDPFT